VNIHSLLFEYYLAWQRQVGEIKTWKDFSDLIGIDHVYLNKIYNGKRNAGEKTIQHLSKYFNDPRFYDAVGLDRPELLLTYTKRNWGSLPEEVKKKIAEEVAQYTSDPIPNNEGGEIGK
jgi:transcriptional regulator with XRE-family HTH domain